MKNLVMGFATNQPERSVRLFCESLRKIYSSDQCDVAIITNRFEPYFSDLSALGIRFLTTVNSYGPKTGRISKAFNRVILGTFKVLTRLRFMEKVIPEILSAYPILIEVWHHPHFARWFAYQRALLVGERYGQVLLADVKDVVFQVPFFVDSPAREVQLFAESVNFGKDDYWNTMWYRKAFGKAELKKVLGKRPICIGTILGPHESVLSVVQELTDAIQMHLFGRIEQAVFNNLIHTGRLRTPYTVIENLSGPVGTLDVDGLFTIRGGLICRSGDGRIIPVVHMYDRFPETRELYGVDD